MKMSMKSAWATLLALAMLLSVTACGGNPGSSQAQSQPQQPQSQVQESSQPQEEDYDGKLVSEGVMPLQYAKLFEIELYKGGYRMISAGTEGFQYLVVPEGMTVPEGLDENVQVLQKPIDSVYSASTSLISLTNAIGGLDNIKLCATAYDSWNIDAVIKQMDAGALAYSGSYKEPDYELVTGTGIQLHLDTTMVENNPEVLEKFRELEIPSLVENSSLEEHPLGRVEWVKLMGVLFDKEEEAEKFFSEQIDMFESATVSESYGKTVALGYITSDGKAYARNGGDYLAQLIEMAGGDYILSDMEPEKTGNSSMTFEEWYNKFADADYLFYFNLGQKFYSVQEMIDYNPLFADFKAVKEGRVWITRPGFTQFSAELASIVTDMNTILSSSDPSEITTDFLIKIS